ncbi:MAG: lipid asymmetry maintenance ABC transporter permease subunit MlaE [Pseudomonadota bacterium]
MKYITELFERFREFAQTFGASQLFLLRMLWLTPAALLRPGLVIRQIHNAGVLSLTIVMVCGLFVGMVLGLHGYDTLMQYGSEESLGLVAAKSLLRELGPVVTALLFAGRAGTALTSEIGLMKATDQLSALEMMAVDPVKRIMVPRFIGGVVAMPLLAALFSAVGIFGAYLFGVPVMGVDEGAFWTQMQDGMDLFDDILSGILKSFVFGVAASLLAVYEGQAAIPTAEGVSRATTRTVVKTAMSILILDFIITALLFNGA